MNAGFIKPTLFRDGKNKHYVYQDGKVVFKFAVSRMADVVAEMVKK